MPEHGFGGPGLEGTFGAGWIEFSAGVSGGVEAAGGGLQVVYGAAGGIRKFTLDVATGRFTIRAIGSHQGVGPDGDLDVSLWIGKHYEAVRIVPEIDESDGSFVY